jgi:hypothetical protein
VLCVGPRLFYVPGLSGWPYTGETGQGCCRRPTSLCRHPGWDIDNGAFFESNALWAVHAHPSRAAGASPLATFVASAGLIAHHIPDGVAGLCNLCGGLGRHPCHHGKENHRRIQEGRGGVGGLRSTRDARMLAPNSTREPAFVPRGVASAAEHVSAPGRR